MTKILICGDRNWGRYPDPDPELTDDEFLALMGSAMAQRVRLMNWLDRFVETHQLTSVTVIEGEAPGADTLARLWGEDRGYRVCKFPAQWGRFGRAAGPLRNTQMLDEAKPEHAIAFHDNLAESRGTGNMVRQLLGRGHSVWVVTTDGEDLRVP